MVIAQWPKILEDFLGDAVDEIQEVGIKAALGAAKDYRVKGILCSLITFIFSSLVDPRSGAIQVEHAAS